jgi:hypothetical protein
MATHANWLLNGHVYGYAMQEANVPFDSADALADMTEEVYLLSLAEQFPYLNESATELLAIGYDPTQEFLYGIDLLLDALDARRIGG